MKERIHELDALRGLAALYVLAFHFAMNKPQFHNLLNPGATGVDLFFMISGFVIFMTLTHTTNLTAFAINRFTRLFPTFWVCVTITFVVVTFATVGFRALDKGYWANYLGNMTMMPQYFKVRQLDGSYWTMLVELLFYTFMAVICGAKLLRRINLIGYGFLAVCLFYSILLKAHRPEIYEDIKFGFPLINYFPLFFAGILFYQLWNKGRNLYLIPGVLSCFVVQLVLFDDGKVTKLFVSFGQYTFWIGFYFILFLLFVKKFLKFIAIQPLIYLGTISYSMYLLHQSISKTYLIPMFYDKFNHNTWLSFICSFAVIFALASLVTFFIERPSTTVLKQRLYSFFRI